MLILNASYLLFVWPFMKICEAFRLPYMETEIPEFAERTTEKLKQLTEEEFAGLVFLPAEDMK